MKVKIHHIPSHGLDLALHEPADRFASLKQFMENGEGEFTDPLDITLQLLPMRDFIKATGHIKTAIRQPCVRCLTDFNGPLETRFTLNCSKEIPQELHRDPKEGVELTAQQIGILYYKGDEIDFRDALQEQVILAIPYRPLCRRDCKGLCATCGHNLNQSTCRCGDHTPDGPFAVLQQLKRPSK